ncbi:hypothetical protein BDZ97DRAFT_1675394 [Flammula alnicola]|nr:hypothetical protein BDZ97DRAFT_1675394 [Flammula alnicola]
MIGAAAVLLYGHQPPRVARHHLGSEEEHTVFEGENVGQVLGLRLLQTSGLDLSNNSITMAIDNQPSIRRHSDRKPGAGAYLVHEAHHIFQEIKARYPRTKITLRWIPSHTGIRGSDLVDKEAKVAATKGAAKNKGSNFGILKKPLPVSKSAWKQALRSKVKECYRKKFKSSPRYERAAKIDPSIPSNRFRKLSASLSR